VLRRHRDLIGGGTPDVAGPAGSGGYEPSGRSAGWSCAWPERTPPGDIAESTANCSSCG
jgi:hypothetical protein